MDLSGGRIAPGTRRMRRLPRLGPPVRVNPGSEDVAAEDPGEGGNENAPPAGAFGRHLGGGDLGGGWPGKLGVPEDSVMAAARRTSQLALADESRAAAEKAPPQSPDESVTRLPSPPRSASHRQGTAPIPLQAAVGSAERACGPATVSATVSSGSSTASGGKPPGPAAPVVSAGLRRLGAASTSTTHMAHTATATLSTGMALTPGGATAGAAASQDYAMLFEPRVVMVNGKPYNRLDRIGRGGSSKVYKVLTPARQILALKRVHTRATDPKTVEGYLNEIELLLRLRGNPRIIELLDWEQTPDGISMVLECGEIDLARLLFRTNEQGMSMNFVRLYWEQMLEAVQTIHEASIVHTDLKPANFIVVAGALKLIDFGIARAISNDTTNIHRDEQTGTCNYMSPESLSFVDSVHGSKTLKLGRSSDVWSLGCILYQMVYGTPPFAHLAMIPKLQAIVNESYAVAFPGLGLGAGAARLRPRSGAPSTGTPSAGELLQLENPVLYDVLRSCLQRQPKLRPTIPQLLEHAFLFPGRPVGSALSKPSAPPVPVRRTALRPFKPV